MFSFFLFWIARGTAFALFLFMWIHWVARTNHPYEPFREFEVGRWFWNKLGEHFPEMLSAVLMPNHFHLILPAQKQREDFQRLTGLMGALSRRVRARRLWQSEALASDIPDRFHLRRQIRYVALNPCRKGLCSDPLEWYWSTYRELMGAAAEKSVCTMQIAATLNDSLPNFRVRFHAYVSGDPSVRVVGTVFPRAEVPRDYAEESIGEILAAAAAALRVHPSELKNRGSALRTLFIHLAVRHGWSQPKLLAQISQLCPSSVCRIRQKRNPAGLAEAELCLGDSRLRNFKMN